MYKKLIIFSLVIFGSMNLFSQVVADSTNFSIYYDSAKKYTLAGIEVSGIRFLDTEVLKNLSGLTFTCMLLTLTLLAGAQNKN